jgi:hypothetical protein
VDHNMSNAGLSWKTWWRFPPVLLRPEPTAMCESIRAPTKPNSLTHHLNSGAASVVIVSMYQFRINITPRKCAYSTGKCHRQLAESAKSVFTRCVTDTCRKLVVRKPGLSDQIVGLCAYGRGRYDMDMSFILIHFCEAQSP